MTCTARMASGAFSGRMDTTSGPWNGPAAAVGMSVRNMATLRPWATWRNGTPACSSAVSNVNEQPITKLTRSSRQRAPMSVGSSTATPSRQTR